MPLCTRAALKFELLVVVGLLLAISACFPQQPQPLSAGAVVEMGPAGTPKLVKGTDLAGDLESSHAYGVALQGADYGEMARLFLAHRADLFKLADLENDLQPLAATPDGLGHQHAKFQQVVNGIPIWQKTLTVHFDPQGRIYRVDGDYLPTPVAVDTHPALNEVAARAKALKGIAGDGGSWKVEASELIVYAAAGDAPRLAYRFTVGKGLTGREDRIVAADTGQLLKRLSRINQ